MASRMLPPRRASRAIGNEIDYNLANLERIVLEKAKAEGDIDFINLLRDIEDLELVQEAASSHYDVSYKPGDRGPTRDRGKLDFTPKSMHGGSSDLNALNARAMALETELYGPVVERRWAPGQSPSDIRLREAVNRVVSARGANQLAGVGLRPSYLAAMSNDERLLRASDRLAELSQGYNPITGAPYAGQGLDGGHRAAHTTNPHITAKRENMMFENKYENRAKGNREGDEAALAFYNSLRRKILASANRDADVPVARFAKVWPVGVGY